MLPVSGKGRMTYPDGSFYEGEFGNGMRAKGKCQTADGLTLLTCIPEVCWMNLPSP